MYKNLYIVFRYIVYRYIGYRYNNLIFAHCQAFLHQLQKQAGDPGNLSEIFV